MKQRAICLRFEEGMGCVVLIYSENVVGERQEEC